MVKISFKEVKGADLIVDCIYEGGTEYNDLRDEPLRRLFPSLGTGGGFRKVKRKDGSGKFAYVVLFTSMEELEWPDYLDVEQVFSDIMETIENLAKRCMHLIKKAINY